MKNKIEDFITKDEVRRFDLEFSGFWESQNKQKWGERRIMLNRFRQTFKVLLYNFFI